MAVAGVGDGDVTESILSSIEFQMSLLLFVALAGYLIASRINQSAVVGEILVGIVVGPSVLGLITYTDFVQSLAHLGAIFLLFTIGFEFCIRDLTDPRYLAIAFVGVVLPWIGGYLATALLGYLTASALFVGTAAKAVIGAAVIDNVLALLVLGITTDTIQGSIELPAIDTSLVSAVLFIGLRLLAGLKIVSPMLVWLDCQPLARQYPEFVFITALAIAFFYAMVAELIRLSAIVGAFIAGVSCREIALCHSKNPREGAEYLQVIFAAIFFVSLGIIVDLRALTPAIAVLVSAITLARYRGRTGHGPAIARGIPSVFLTRSPGRRLPKPAVFRAESNEEKAHTATEASLSRVKNVRRMRGRRFERPNTFVTRPSTLRL